MTTNDNNSKNAIEKNTQNTNPSMTVAVEMPELTIEEGEMVQGGSSAGGCVPCSCFVP